MIPLRSMLIVLVLAAIAYGGLSRAVFVMPASIEEAEACGFTSTEFAPTGQLEYSSSKAWALSFVRKGEYWSAFALGLTFSFLYFAISSARRIGGAATTGSAVGGGLLVLATVCLSCLAPALSVVGLGVAVGALAGFPKWLMALNTLLVTAWGTLFVSRRLATCPVDRSRPSTATSEELTQ